MITRLYANNFRCLVSFEAAFDSFGVLCGPNGAGKSSVFDALGMLRSLGTGDGIPGGTGELDSPRLELTSDAAKKLAEFCKAGRPVNGMPASLRWSCKNWHLLVDRMT